MLVALQRKDTAEEASASWNGQPGEGYPKEDWGLALGFIEIVSTLEICLKETALTLEQY